MKCPFNVGDEVRILPEMEAWTYFVRPMYDYIGDTARVVEIANDGVDYYCKSGYRIWLDVDDEMHFWNPDYCEPILPPISILETTISALL